MHTYIRASAEKKEFPVSSCKRPIGNYIAIPPIYSHDFCGAVRVTVIKDVRKEKVKLSCFGIRFQ